MAKRFSKGDKVIDRTGQGPKGTVVGHKQAHGRSLTRVRWDDGKTGDWPTIYLKKSK